MRRNIIKEKNSPIETIVEALLHEIAATNNRHFFGKITLILKIGNGAIQSASIQRETLMAVTLKNAKDEK